MANLVVVRRGFEPRKTKSADLQSALVGHLSISPNSKNRSNTEAEYSVKSLEWSWLRDLNPRPSAYKADALPTELNQQKNKRCNYIRFIVPLSRNLCKYKYLKIKDDKISRIHKQAKTAYSQKTLVEKDNYH